MSINLEVRFPCETVIIPTSCDMYERMQEIGKFWLAVDGDGQVYATKNKPTYYAGDEADECETSEWWDGSAVGSEFVSDLGFDEKRDTSHMVLRVTDVATLL